MVLGATLALGSEVGSRGAAVSASAREIWPIDNRGEECICLPLPFFYRAVNSALAQAGIRPVGTWIEPEDRLGLGYRVIIYERDCASRTQTVTVLEIQGRVGLVGDSERKKYIREFTMEGWRIVVTERDGPRQVSRARTQMTEEMMDRWFNLLQRSELFSLPPAMKKVADDGTHGLQIGGEVWVFERWDPFGMKVLARSDDAIGGPRIVRDHVVEMVKQLFDQSRADLPRGPSANGASEAK